MARRWTFSPTPPLSTYNPVVVAGPFVELRREAGGYDMGLYARQTLASVLERDSELALHPHRAGARVLR